MVQKRAGSARWIQDSDALERLASLQTDFSRRNSPLQPVSIEHLLDHHARQPTGCVEVPKDVSIRFSAKRFVANAQHIAPTAAPVAALNGVPEVFRPLHAFLSVGWSGLFRQRVGEFKVDSATSLNYRPRGLYRNSMSSSSRLLLVPYLCCG